MALSLFLIGFLFNFISDRKIVKSSAARVCKMEKQKQESPRKLDRGKKEVVNPIYQDVRSLIKNEKS